MTYFFAAREKKLSLGDGAPTGPGERGRQIFFAGGAGEELRQIFISPAKKSLGRREKISRAEPWCTSDEKPKSSTLRFTEKLVR